MIIEYNVSCFERTLVIKCPGVYDEHEKEIKQILDKAYYAWHSPEDIEDPEEREWVEHGACCEEYMIYKMCEKYHVDHDDWDSFYYGDDEGEIAEDMENHQDVHKYNGFWLNNAIKHFTDINDRFEPFEKLGNEAYWTAEDCIKKLKALKEKYVEEEE